MLLDFFVPKYTILNLNVRAIVNKRNLIEILLKEKEPDIVIFTEHWLKKDEIDRLTIMDYVIVSNYCRKNGYGGVLIAINKKLPNYVTPIDIINNLSVENTIEIAAIRLNHNKKL